MRVAKGKPNAESDRLRLRWRPAAAWIALILGALGLIRLIDLSSSQERNILAAVVFLVGLLGLAVWWTAISGLPWRTRLLGLAAAACAGGVFCLFFHVRGVTGDLVPIIEFRWRPSPRPLETAPPPTARETAGRPIRFGQDFPGFLGPDRNAVVEGAPLAADWSARPPEIVWRRPIGAGWSGFAIAGGLAYTQEQRGEREFVTCYDAATGKQIWACGYRARYAATLAGEGPRCAPAIADGKVFALGATGVLSALEAKSGRLLWRRRITEDAGAKVPEWGFAGSPLVWKGLVIVSAGGRDGRSLLAYRAADGEPAWAAGDAPASYSSPFLAELSGRRLVLIFNADRISAHNPQTGRVEWEYPWDARNPHVAEPVLVASNRVVFSSGYGVGAELLETRFENGWEVRRIWKSRALKAKFANFIAWRGFLYGLDDGVLACVDLKDGKRRWRRGRYGHGQMLRRGDLLLVTGERGELFLVHPEPSGLVELGRFRVFNVKSWNPPALSGEALLWRNDREAACVRIPLQNAASTPRALGGS